MKINISKRAECEKIIYQVFDKLDPSGDNTKYYKKLLSGMSNTEFEKFFTNLFKDDTLYLPLHVVDFERDVNIEQAEEALKLLQVPLEEYVILPHLNMDKDKPIATLHKMIVGYNINKRMQQTKTKKNSTSIEISDRSPVTGQVTGDDKNARSSDQENIALTAMGADEVLQELLGPRADDIVAKNQMYADIATNGYCTLDNLQSELKDKTMLNTSNVMFLGMGLKVDLIDEGLLLSNSEK